MNDFGVSKHVDEARLIETVVDAVSISSPTGHEQDMAVFVAGRLRELGLDVVIQQVEDGRANVLGTLEGAGGGPTLLLNGHMDTSYIGTEPWLAGIPGFQPKGFVEDGYVYGLGVSNMKGALCAFIEALRALRDGGVRLRGDVLFSAVCGEIEKAPWGDEFQAKEFRGYSTGSRWLAAHGGVADYCLLGEPTEHKVVLAHFGSMWVRLSTSGPFMHTAWAHERADENSIARMNDIVGEVRDWFDEWAKTMAYQGVPAVANLGAIRGGHPSRASRSPHRTDLFIDLRVPPDRSLADARAELMRFVRVLRERHPGHQVEVEVYLSASGSTIAEESPLVAAIDSAHRQVFGEQPERDVVHWYSDAGALTAAGIPTLNYGTGSGLPGAVKGENLEVRSLVAITNVYALAIAGLSGVSS